MASPFDMIAQELAARATQPSVPLSPPNQAQSPMAALAQALASRVSQPSVPLSPSQGNAVMPPWMAPSAQPPVAPAGTPSVPVSLPNNSLPKPASPQLPWWATGNMAQMFPGAHAAAPVTAPAAPPQQAALPPGSSIPGAVGPTSVGGAPLMHNYGLAGSQASLPNGSSIPGAVGPTSVGGAPLNQGSTLMQRFAASHPQTASWFGFRQPSGSLS